jgi:hypothetical protein
MKLLTENDVLINTVETEKIHSYKESVNYKSCLQIHHIALNNFQTMIYLLNQFLDQKQIYIGRSLKYFITYLCEILIKV